MLFEIQIVVLYVSRMETSYVSVLQFKTKYIIISVTFFVANVHLTMDGKYGKCYISTFIR